MRLTHLTPLCAAPLLCAAPAGAAYEYTSYDYPGSTVSGFTAVNDLGAITGIFEDTSTDPPSVRAFLLENGHAAPIDPDGVIGQSPVSTAYSINSFGTIAGSYQDASGVKHGFVLKKDGTMSPVEYPGGFPTEAYSINDFGHVVGGYYTPDGNIHAFSLVDGIYKTKDVPGALTTAPYAINDIGEVVGYFSTVAGTNGQAYFRAPDGRLTLYNFPGAPANSTNFVSINNLGETLGNYVDAAGNYNNFLLFGDKSTPVVLPTSFGSWLASAEAINDTGEIVGFYIDASNLTHGFIGTRR
jgi:uncharacterized membrane protein